MLFVDIETTFHLFRLLFHIVLAIFFFAVWRGPGQRRLTWLLWTLAFIIDTVQVTLQLCTATWCASQFMVWAQFGLSLLWLWTIITASYMWRPEDSKIRKWPYLFGTTWMLIMTVSYAFGIRLGDVGMSVYMLGVMLFLGHIYARVGGVLLGLLGIWSGGGDSLGRMAASIVDLELTTRAVILTNMSVELASLALFLTILYLYLNRISKERDAYEAQLRSMDNEQKQALCIAADLVQMGNVAAKEDLDGSTMRYNGELATSGKHI
jgi:hypothetical protein